MSGLVVDLFPGDAHELELPCAAGIRRGTPMIMLKQSPWRGHLGFHANDRESGSRLAFRREAFERWLGLFGMKNGGGAPAAWKVYDETQVWRGATAPEEAPEFITFLAGCAEFDFTPVVSYCCFTRDNPGSLARVVNHRSALREAMRKFFRRLPMGAAVIFCNEREQSWEGDPELFFEIEAEFGALAKEYGLLWYVGADQVEAHTLDTIAQRMAWWKRFGVEPDGIAFHSYGQSGALARHIRDLMDAMQRITGRAWSLIWTEWGWGFPGRNKTRGDRRDLERLDTGAWCGEFTLALQQAGAQGCAFTIDQHFNEDGPTAAAEEFADTVRSGTVVNPRQPPAEEAKKKTWRYLSAGRSAIGKAWARVLGLAVAS